MKNRFPICLIKLTTAPSLVEVNVHPSKLEVRFTNEKELLEMITSTIRNALDRTNMIMPEDQVFVDDNNEEASLGEVSEATLTEDESPIILETTNEVHEDIKFEYSEPKNDHL